MSKTYKHKIHGCTMTYADGCMKIENLVIEGHPNLEYWEEIIADKEYEILSYKSLGYTTYPEQFTKVEREDPQRIINQDYVIHSIKRLSDGKVFTIGDNLIYTKYGDSGKLLSIDFERAPADKGTGKLCFVNDNELLGDWCLLKDLKKVEEVLFTTEDGVNIYANDIFYYVGDAWNICETKCLFKGDGDFSKLKTFAQKENAEKFIKEKGTLSFPKLMMSYDGMVILFTSKGTGTVIVAVDKNNYVGEYSEDWDISLFYDFRGELKIEQ